MVFGTMHSTLYFVVFIFGRKPSVVNRFSLIWDRPRAVLVWVQLNNKKTLAVNFSDFYVEDESDNYRLHVSAYNGTAGDKLRRHNGMQFSTKDRDNDIDSR